MKGKTLTVERVLRLEKAFGADGLLNNLTKDNCIYVIR